MLILKRNVGESIVVRNALGEIVCRVVVTAVQEGKAKLGFLAEKDITIDRSEVDIKRHTVGAVAHGSALIERS